MAGHMLIPMLTAVCTPSERLIRMLLVLFFILLVIWLLAWAAFHVAGGFIHILLILAVISIIAHFFRGRRAV
jgi:hypothetical protein